MNEYTIPGEQCHVSQCTSLAVVSMFIRHHNLLQPLRDMVKVPQKTILYTPIDKLCSAFLAILAGSRGLVDINKLVRSDPALQAAFGLTGCAEQSVVQDTLDACTADTVAQMQQAVVMIFRQHSASYRHDYKMEWQLLDVDTTGKPCGPTAEMAAKGYFGEQRYRRGRQLGRVLATHYHEIVVDQLSAGNTPSVTVFQPLVIAAEQALELDDEKRSHTILRIDAGSGSVDNINWALRRGYQVHGKDYSGNRAPILARSVTQWVSDPRVRGREIGWVTAQPTEYVRPVRRVAVRCRKKNGQWAIGVIVSSLEPEDVLAVMKRPPQGMPDDLAILLAYVYFYDERGGGVETAIKDDKQGLAITKRNKKRFPAQQMVMWLDVLAHNILVWVRRELAAVTPKLARYGIFRMVRDILQIRGILVKDEHGRCVAIILNEASRLARLITPSFQALVAPAHVIVRLGET